MILTAVLCSQTARGITPACTAASNFRPVRLGRHAATRLLMSEQRPSYPPLARINYIGGHVSLLLTIDCTGKVRDIHVVKGHPFLAIAALDAIRKWIYRPFVTPSGPAAFQTTVQINFSLLTQNFKGLPPEPEKFLERSVLPPQPPKHAGIAGVGDTVLLRVLVSDKGHVVDSTLLSGTPSQYEMAKRAVGLWKFKPARWGNLSVPWYAEVKVPVGSPVQSGKSGGKLPRAASGQ